MTTAAAAVLDVLQYGPLRAFGVLEAHGPPTDRVRRLHDLGRRRCAFYVGVSGRSATSRTGSWGRLRSHWSSRRTGDQFCVYVADHYVLRDLTAVQVEAIVASDPTLYVDDLVAAICVSDQPVNAARRVQQSRALAHRGEGSTRGRPPARRHVQRGRRLSVTERVVVG